MLMKNSKTKYIILYLITLIPVIMTVILYSRLPDQIPTHWNIQGQVNKYGDRNSSFLTAAIPFIIVLLMQVVPKIDPKKRNYASFEGAYYNFQLMLAVVMGGIHMLALITALGYEFIKVDTGIKLLLAVMFTIIGNMMPKFKHNYFIGIRTPWTLANENVWFATHRLGGKLWFYGGLLMIIFSFVPGPISGAVYFTVIMGTTFFMVLYSYLVFRKQQG